MDINESVLEEVCVVPETDWVRLQWDWCGPGFYLVCIRTLKDAVWIFLHSHWSDCLILCISSSLSRVSVVSVLSDPPAGLCHTQLHEQSRCSPAEGGQGGALVRPPQNRQAIDAATRRLFQVQSCEKNEKLLRTGGATGAQLCPNVLQSEQSVNTSSVRAVSKPIVTKHIITENCQWTHRHWTHHHRELNTAFWINNKHHIHISTSRDMNLTGVWTHLSRWHKLWPTSTERPELAVSSELIKAAGVCNYEQTEIIHTWNRCIVCVCIIFMFNVAENYRVRHGFIITWGSKVPKQANITL